MNTGADYVAAIAVAIVLIALFINLRNGTLGQWLKAKFLGLSSAAPGGPALKAAA